MKTTEQSPLDSSRFTIRVFVIKCIYRSNENDKYLTGITEFIQCGFDQCTDHVSFRGQITVKISAVRIL